MNLISHFKRPPWRTLLLLIPILAVLSLGYVLWSPGKRIIDGRHDRRTNGIWIQHGWLGDDQWFKQNRRDKAKFRSDHRVKEFADLLASRGVKYVFPHLCPSSANGKIAQVDPQQTMRFLNHFEGFKVIPWIGGVLGVHCSPGSLQWRKNFVSSTLDLFQSHPQLAGVQINIEPMPSGNRDFLILLRELRQTIPAGKILSVAAYPPPTRWQPIPEVHWEEAYFRQVAARVDQVAVMMYDTAIRLQKPYQYVMSKWTSHVLDWSEDCEVLLGVPVYDDSGTGYHFPRVENLKNALFGIHAGLARYHRLPDNYKGISIYCEWEMDEREWAILRREFGKAP